MGRHLADLLVDAIGDDGRQLRDHHVRRDCLMPDCLMLDCRDWLMGCTA